MVDYFYNLFAPTSGAVRVDDASSEFKHVDLVTFRELVTSLGLYYEDECWPTLHQLVESWSRSPDELEAGQKKSA